MVEDRPVITIRPNGTHLTRQQLPNFEGISAIIADSTKLCMHLVVIPPNVPHQPVNLSEIEEVIAMVASNDPNEQGSVVIIETPAAWS